MKPLGGVAEARGADGLSEQPSPPGLVGRECDPDYFADELVNGTFIVSLRGARSRGSG